MAEKAPPCVDLTPGNERNHPRPCSVDSFERALKEAVGDCDIELRIRWAPEVERFEVDVDGNPRMGKTYAVLPKVRDRGWFVGHVINNQFEMTGHKPPYALPRRARDIRGDGRIFITPKKGEVWARDTWVEQIAFPRWVIEQKIDDQLARRLHQENQTDWVNPRTGMPVTEQERRGWGWFHPETGALIDDAGRELLRAMGVEAVRRTFDPVIPVRRDILGPFPQEGWWKCFLVVAFHYNDLTCCKKIFPGFCYGAYREPGEPELIEVRKAIWYRQHVQKRLHANEEPPTAHEINDFIGKTMAEIEAGENRAEQETIEMLQNAIGPGYKAHEIAFGDFGAARRKADELIAKSEAESKPLIELATK